MIVTLVVACCGEIEIYPQRIDPIVESKWECGGIMQQPHHVNSEWFSNLLIDISQAMSGNEEAASRSNSLCSFIHFLWIVCNTWHFTCCRFDWWLRWVVKRSIYTVERAWNVHWILKTIHKTISKGIFIGTCLKIHYAVILYSRQQWQQKQYPWRASQAKTYLLNAMSSTDLKEKQISVKIKFSRFIFLFH